MIKWNVMLLSDLLNATILKIYIYNMSFTKMSLENIRDQGNKFEKYREQIIYRSVRRTIS